MAIKIREIEKDLLARHADDPIKLSKVHRYIRFLKIDISCDKEIDNDGTISLTYNSYLATGSLFLLKLLMVNLLTKVVK
ncbi:hypothetical protein [Lysinibacillus sp. K60]|uniref:hypothetical protein n=1 Tax=Lysinibacillus sp. K60 TaxID=2720027 RepID=UPI001C8CCCB7|nr:hypothetical protein [Lysinibacillus sp. K60]MBX8945620.1 hypothetical protein [Lysinibacillus sp. K60]